MTPAAEATIRSEVLELIRAWTETEVDGNQSAHGSLWTGYERLRSEAHKPSTEVSKGQVADVIESLVSDGEVLRWHGLLAPADEDHLRAIIENERQAEFTRRILVGKCNRLLSDGAQEGGG